LNLPRRIYAEIVHTLVQNGLHGEFQLPKRENVAQQLKAKCDARLSVLVAKAHQLANSRTSDDKKSADLANLLQYWLIHGKPTRKPKAEPEPTLS